NSAQQEPRMSENPVLEYGEGMLRQATAQSHHVRCGPLLHALQSFLVQVTLHETLRRGGAPRLQPTAATGLRRCHIDHPPFAGLCLFAAEDLLGRTAEGVGLLVVSKLAAIEQAAVSAIVHTTLGRHVGQDALRFAGLRLLSVGVAGIRYYVQPRVITQRLFG